MRAHARLCRVVRHPERHDAETLQIPIFVSDVGERLVEHISIVEPRTDNYLAMHLDTSVEKGSQPSQARCATSIPQQVLTNRRVGRMNRHVQWAELLCDGALKVGLCEARQRGVVAIQERQPIVVVLEIQTLSQARRQLIDEAELTVVVTRSDLVKEGRVHFDPDRTAYVAVDVDIEMQTIAENLERHFGFIDERSVLKNVTWLFARDADKLVADRDPGPVGSGPRFYRDDTWKAHGSRVRPTVARSALHWRLVTVDQVLLAAPRGFCAGVEMAIKALAALVRAYPPPVYCYHEIVHNRLVVQRFEDLGVVFVDDIAEVPDGAPVMLSAHGSAPEVVRAAIETGGTMVDAVCPLVTKVHHEVKVRAGKGFEIVYVGHDGHEEAVGTMAVAPDAIHRVESVAEVECLPEIESPVALLAQTTLSHRDWASVQDAALDRWPEMWTPGRSDLCFATTNRQGALEEIAPRCDAVVVIGSSNSSNTMALARLASESGCSRVCRVNTADELPHDLSGTVGVTAGASASEELVESVIDRLAPRHGVSEVRITEEDEYFPPPRALRDLLAAVDAAAALSLGARRETAPPTGDRALGASEVLRLLG